MICCSGDLPEVFTICSSVLAEHVTVDINFFQLYKVKFRHISQLYSFSWFVEGWLALAHIVYDGHRQKSSKKDGRKVKTWVWLKPLSPSRSPTLKLVIVGLVKNFVWRDLNILTGSPWVTMKSSTNSLIRGYPLILSLGTINAQKSTPDLVLSPHNHTKLFFRVCQIEWKGRRLFFIVSPRVPRVEQNW